MNRPISIGFSGTDAAYQTMVGIGARYLTGIGAGNVTRGTVNPTLPLAFASLSPTRPPSPPPSSAHPHVRLGLT